MGNVKCKWTCFNRRSNQLRVRALRALHSSWNPRNILHTIHSSLQSSIVHVVTFTSSTRPLNIKGGLSLKQIFSPRLTTFMTNNTFQDLILHSLKLLEISTAADVGPVDYVWRTAWLPLIYFSTVALHETSTSPCARWSPQRASWHGGSSGFQPGLEPPPWTGRAGTGPEPGPRHCWGWRGVLRTWRKILRTHGIRLRMTCRFELESFIKMDKLEVKQRKSRYCLNRVSKESKRGLMDF